MPEASMNRLPISDKVSVMDQSSITQNRRSNRSPMLLSAQIDMGGQPVSVVLRNLSSEGALIEGAKLPLVGTSTVFRRNELTVNGCIVWVQGRLAGIAFDRKLEREELLRQVPKPRQRFDAQFRRPGLACQPLTEADSKMLELWATSAPVAETGK
jgi:hypothetical protein